MLLRREFLQQLAAAASALALDPLRGVSALAGRYANARLGLSLRPPEGWEPSSIADFAALRDQTVLYDALAAVADEPHPLKDPANLPVFLFEDPRHRSGHFAPGICLYDEELLELPPVDERAAHALLLRQLDRAYGGLTVRESPRKIRLSGAAATLSRFSYRHELESGEALSLDTRALLVFRPPQVHTFYLVDSLSEPRTPPQTWRGFLGSIRYRARSADFVRAEDTFERSGGAEEA